MSNFKLFEVTYSYVSNGEECYEELFGISIFIHSNTAQDATEIIQHVANSGGQLSGNIFSRARRVKNTINALHEASDHVLRIVRTRYLAEFCETLFSSHGSQLGDNSRDLFSMFYYKDSRDCPVGSFKTSKGGILSRIFLNQMSLLKGISHKILLRFQPCGMAFIKIPSISSKRFGLDFHEGMSRIPKSSSGIFDNYDIIGLNNNKII